MVGKMLTLKEDEQNYNRQKTIFVLTKAIIQYPQINKGSNGRLWSHILTFFPGLRQNFKTTTF